MDDLRLEILRGSPMPEGWNWSRQILESMANGITVADATLADLPLVYINPAFERMTGYSRQEVIGRNCRFLQGTDRDQRGLADLRRAVHEGIAVTTVLRNYRKDGTAFWNELYLSPIRDGGGRVTHFAGIQNDVTRRVELEEKLAYMSQHDMLTGLANRALLMERTEEALRRADATRRLVAVLFFDLDNFKMVNDMFGHDAGDGVLRIVSERLQGRMRSSETAARLGGDEFVVVLEDLRNEDEVHAVVERLTKDIQQPVQVAGQEFTPSTSVGMALYPSDGKTAEELLRVSDTAMYFNKHLRRRQHSRDEGFARSAQGDRRLRTDL